jgi:hypothetical protein
MLKHILNMCLRYPIHLQPLSNQIFQFLQIASNMISELKLDRSLDKERDRLSEQDEARDACLACFYMSSM